MLFLSACTKEDLQNNNPSTPAGNNSPDPYVISYSNWTADASFSWSDGATTEPSRQFDLAALELTQELLDAGSFVLVYAQSNIDGSVQAMPAVFSDVNNNESNSYSANYVAGSISLSHTRSVNGVFEVPNDSNEISFRYIVVKPNEPDPNGRQITIYDLLYMPYKDVVNLLGIPE
jgi:hypothetical protein